MVAKQLKQATLEVVSEWWITLEILKKIEDCMKEGLFNTKWIDVEDYEISNSLKVYFKHLGYMVSIGSKLPSIKLFWEEDIID